ncbi:MAG: hypothetical protein DKM50_02430 [Candidatus Margulisiibacteriota bacterium]|nr:MAG: hypothetical protein A2X43_03790 [Candidatus Margulisbacteria bacterium GWD2_39_127]OGI02464.1 MAG: hypothetical protein A2X42_07255 [Candidatus Margulisbacteria bacterium GWF2_38_17]PZM83152.1 MAG: hypothetical protein DKM50_02430 [Candidatus Margulisiibacteriota bacterium]HAR62547.1 hypothetical protein [Candidatus Margulisiibacteriota bacterium]HCY38088.1 hypothetical protein [Candidatus Margulisiibacteriota bacterium]
MSIRKTILIAEDNAAISHIYQRLCETYFDVNVLTAENGVKALKLVNNSNIDFILCDVMMPEMDGLELITRIRESDKNREVPIVMCTTLADQRTILQGIKSGANDILVKPVPQRLLLEKIIRYLNIEPIKKIS